MKAYSRGRVLLLTITLCAIWTSIVNGAVAETSTTEYSTKEGSADGPNDVDDGVQPDITKLLPSVMQGITNVTGKPLVMFGDSLEKLAEIMANLHEAYIDNSNCILQRVDNGMEFTCKLMEETNNILTLRSVTEKPQHVYLSVHQENMPKDTTASDIKQYCSIPRCQNRPCSTKECPTPTTQYQETSTKVSQTECTYYFYKCHTEVSLDWCQACTTETSAKKQGSSQSIGGDTLPIVIASIVSFFAGIVVCLLALCLIGRFHGRLCLKFINSSKYNKKTAKTQNQVPLSSTYTTSALEMTEHQYHDLRCEATPNPNREPLYAPEDISPILQKQPNTVSQTTEYETMSAAQKDHVYSGLGSRESTHSTVYEHTLPNRSSEHEYSSMQDVQHNDRTTRLQHSPVNISSEIATTSIIDARSKRDIDANQVPVNDYFVLDKEQYSTNQLKLVTGRVTDDRSMHNSTDEQVEPSEYFILAKEQQATSQPKPEVTDDNSTVTHDTVTEEPNNYFVLEKESHPAIQPEPEAVEEPDI